VAIRMGLLGKKIGMTQVFGTPDGDAKTAGRWQAVTAILAGPCVVLAKLTPEKNGYAAIRLGFDDQKAHRVNKPLGGQFSAGNTTPKRFIQEIQLKPEELDQFSVGQSLKPSQVFKVGQKVDVTARSKGKGFQGVMKRHNFKGFRATHGTHEYFRHGGSIGCRLTPGRVMKGKKMPGQMGNKVCTTQNLSIHEILDDKNLVLIAGAVPGHPGSYLKIRHAAKRPELTFELIASTPSGKTENNAPNDDPENAQIESSAAAPAVSGKEDTNSQATTPAKA